MPPPSIPVPIQSTRNQRNPIAILFIYASPIVKASNDEVQRGATPSNMRPHDRSNRLHEPPDPHSSIPADWTQMAIAELLKASIDRYLIRTRVVVNTAWFRGGGEANTFALRGIRALYAGISSFDSAE